MELHIGRHRGSEQYKDQTLICPRDEGRSCPHSVSADGTHPVPLPELLGFSVVHGRQTGTATVAEEIFDADVRAKAAANFQNDGGFVDSAPGDAQMSLVSAVSRGADMPEQDDPDKCTACIEEFRRFLAGTIGDVSWSESA